MNQFKISTRLTLLIGLMSLILIGIGLLGLFGISQSNAGLKTVYEDRTIPLGQVADIERLLLRNRLAIAVSIVTPTPETIQANTAEIEANIAAITKTWDDFMATTLTAEEGKIARQFADDRGRFVREGLRPAMAALHANDVEGVKQIVTDKIRPLYEPVGAGIAALKKLQLDVAQAEYATADARYQMIRIVSISAITAGLLFSVLFGMVLVRGISRALDEAIAAADAVSQGNLATASRYGARTK